MNSPRQIVGLISSAADTDSGPVSVFKKIKIYRGMEQLVARRAHNPKVTGSSPVPATTKDTGNGILFFCLG